MKVFFNFLFLGYIYFRKFNLVWKNISNFEFFFVDNFSLVFFKFLDDYKSGIFFKVLFIGYMEVEGGYGVNVRIGSFSLGSDRKDDVVISVVSVKRRGFAGLRLDFNRMSVYDNVELEEDLESV